MLLRMLTRKSLREIRMLAGQIITIALVLAGGITCFVSLRGTYLSLLDARDRYYEQCRFADVFARLERAPESLVQRIETVPGVRLVETRVAQDVTVPLQGMQRPAFGRLLSLPAGRGARTNAVYLRRGRLPEPGSDEVAVLESFYDAHGLALGSEIPVVLNGKLRDVRVVGVVLSPEFVFAIRPGALADDPKRYAVLWMDRAALASAFQIEGAFNDVTLRVQPSASEGALRAALDHLLAPYGGSGSTGRDGQISHRILTQELSQLKALAGTVPMVFLGVAAFLINMVLGRLIRLQRSDIATLKAVGYTNAEVGRHYLGLVGVVLLPGSALGVALGGWLGRAVLGLYGRSFRFPLLEFQLTTSLVLTAVGVSGVAALVGALGAVRSAVRLPPAEAMRPPAPANYRRGVLERLRLGVLLGPTGMMVLRELQRRPLRTLLSSAGIAGAVALIILGRFGWDSVTSYFEGTFRREQRHDLAVAFDRPASPRVVGQLGRLPGVVTAEGVRAVPIRVLHEHHSRDAILMGLPAEGTLRRLVERGGGREVSLPDDGVLVTKTLGEILRLSVGDRPEIEVREGDRRVVRPVILGFIDESVGLQVYGREDVVAALRGDDGAVSSVLVKVERDRASQLEAALRRSPHVIDVSDVKADMERLFDMNASIINVWTAISIALAACVVFGVVYNNARISLAARSRDLASLRVLGFSRREISSILLWGLTIEVGIATPLGLVVGRFWAERFMASVDPETFRWQVVISARTYALAVAVTLLSAAASALWVRRKLDTLDLISVLKSRE